MRVLRLGSSQDFAGQLPAGARAWEVAQRILAESAEEPVETVVRLTWPDATLAGRVGDWIENDKPDLVCLCISSYWVEAEAVAARFAGPGAVGKLISTIGGAAARRPAITANPLYRALRSAALATAGGAPAFTAESVMPNLDATIRAILRHENVVLVVAGSPFSAAVWAAPRRREQSIRRRQELFRRLQDLCERLHVSYALPELTPASFSMEFRVKDAGHFNERGHAVIGESDGRLMARAWAVRRNDA